MKQYSEMDEKALVRETERLCKEAEKKIKEGLFHEVNVLEQQYYLAKSYLMNPRDIEPGTVYHVHGEAGIFKVSYLNGVMAWGRMNNEEQERAFPIGRLYRPDWPAK